MRRAVLAIALAGLAAACGTKQLGQAEPQISVSAPNDAGPAFNVATGLLFGPVPVLNSKSLPLTLTDIGLADLTLKSITVTPADGTFALQGTAPTTVGGGGGTQTLTIVFTPPAEESYQGSLVISSDDPNNGSLSVPLSGQGSTRCQLAVSPNPLDAGPVGEGGTGLSSLTLTSAGTAPCVISSIALGTGTDPAFTFASSTATPATIPNTGANNSVSLSLRFSPTAQTPDTATGSVVIASTDPDHPSLTVPISGERILAPACAIADPGTVAVGALVVLDGGASSDPGNNTPLSYAWQLLSKPGGSAAVLTALGGPDPEITVDQPGAYSVQLDVINSLGIQDLQSCFATITARPADDLYVEMIWDNLPVNVDLHFLAPGGTLNSTATDCNGYNRNPSGFAATCSDAHLTGPGPDWAADANPSPGTYTVDAFYYSTHGVAYPAVNVTVRIYVYGIVAGVFTQKLTKAGELWQVATIDWPTGTIAQLPVPDGGF